MSNISKHLFNKCICAQTPCSLFHPWSSSCKKGLAILLWNTLLGSAKFFLPIYVVKLILNYKTLNRKFIQDQVYAYIRSVLYGITFGGSFLASACIIAKVKINYFIIMQAGVIGGLSLLLESTENKNIDKILFFNQVIETIINTLSSAKVIKRTRSSETIAFMFVTSILMYLFKTRVKKQKVLLLWFYPDKSIYQGDGTKNGLFPEEHCSHKQSCIDYLYNGAYSYFLIGYLLEIIRRFLPRMFQYLRNPAHFVQLLVNKNNVMMGLFIGGFVTVYRFLCCYFRKKEHNELPSHAVIAAFIAGGAYFLKPNIQIFIIALTSMLQLLWERLTAYYNLPRKIPLSQILFCISTGILVHHRFILHENCPTYVKNMIDVATNNMSTKIHTGFLYNISETEKYLASLSRM